MSTSVRDAATRSLVADLATLYRASEFSHDTITRRLIDPLPLPKELARRRVAPATQRQAHG